MRIMLVLLVLLVLVPLGFMLYEIYEDIYGPSGTAGFRSCDGPDPNFYRKQHGLPPLPALDHPFDEGAIARADVALVGVVEEEDKTGITLRVLKGVKGINEGALYRPRIWDSCQGSPDRGTLWFIAYRNPTLQEPFHESFNEQRNNMFRLRDICGRVTAATAAARLKEKYGLDISTLPAFIDIPALKAKAKEDNLSAEYTLSAYYSCLGDDAEAGVWARKVSAHPREKH